MAAIWDDLETELISEARVQARVRELAREISRDYAERDLFIVGILKGAVMFVADLARQLEIPAAFDFMAISSYGQATKTSGVVRVLKDLDHPVEDKDVLVVEDIVDTGLTLNYLLEYLRARGPRSLRVCALLDKAARRQVEVPITYTGFQIPDKFVVGYGLDYNEHYRQLRSIYVLKPGTYAHEAASAGRS